MSGTEQTQSTYTEPERKTYQEMLAHAKSIHPDARIRAEGLVWQIIIDTEIEENRDVVDPSWAGTPAEEAYRNFEANYGNDLERWSWKNGHGSQPLPLVAAYYNFNIETEHLSEKLFHQKLRENGLGEWLDTFLAWLRDGSIELRELTEQEKGISIQAKEQAKVEALDILFKKFREVWGEEF